MHSLPLFHRLSGERVVVAGDGTMAEAKARLVTRAGGIPCSPAEAHHAKIAFVAMEDERAAEVAALRLKRQGLLVNVADRPDLCDFTLPSVLEREPVLIAVSTGGASAGLAKHLRLRLEAMVPQTIGKLAANLDRAREAIRARWPASDARRAAIDEALEEGGSLDIFDADAHGRVDDWLSGGPSRGAERVIAQFTLASDDPEDLTLRQARLLGKADAVLHDPAIAQAILNRARADAERLPLPAEAPQRGLIVILRRAD